MQKLVVETPEGVAIRVDLAGAGSRAAAALVDLALVAGILLSVTLVLALGARGILGGADEFVVGLLVTGALLCVIVWWFGWQLASNGQSPGKRLLGIRVVSADGSPASGVAFLLRSLILIVDVLPVPAPLGLLLAAATPRHVRLGDLAAGTIVVRAPRAVEPLEPWPGETWSALPARELPLDPRVASQLGAADVDLLREIVVRPSLDPASRERLVLRALAHYGPRLGFAHVDGLGDPRERLRELYLFAREHAATR
jgi:uncharacterized RDD family membrane protein YckC